MIGKIRHGREIDSVIDQYRACVVVMILMSRNIGGHPRHHAWYIDLERRRETIYYSGSELVDVDTFGRKMRMLHVKEE